MRAASQIVFTMFRAYTEMVCLLTATNTPSRKLRLEYTKPPQNNWWHLRSRYTYPRLKNINQKNNLSGKFLTTEQSVPGYWIAIQMMYRYKSESRSEVAVNMQHFKYVTQNLKVWGEDMYIIKSGHLHLLRETRDCVAYFQKLTSDPQKSRGFWHIFFWGVLHVYMKNLRKYYIPRIIYFGIAFINH